MQIAIWTPVLIVVILWFAMLTFFRSWGTAFLATSVALLGLVIPAYAYEVYWLAYLLLVLSFASFVVAMWWMLKDYRGYRIAKQNEQITPWASPLPKQKRK